MSNASTTWTPPEPLIVKEQQRIVSATPESLSQSDHQSNRKRSSQTSRQSQRTSRSAPEAGTKVTGPLESRRSLQEETASDPLKKSARDSAGRRTSSDSVPASSQAETAPTAAETSFTSTSARNSTSTLTTAASSNTPEAAPKAPEPTTTSRALQFYKTASQRKLQEQLLLPTSQPPSSSSSLVSKSSLRSILRLQEEEMEEGLQKLQFRAGVETARQSLHDNIMRKWTTPYDIDPPRRIRLASALSARLSTRSIATTTSSSTGFTSDSDPMAMERQIWNGIEALMADAFSEGDTSSICTEDVLPKSLLRAMSHTSLSSTSNVHSHLTPEEVDEIQMAQAALNSFMDMLLPEDEQEAKQQQGGSHGDSTMPSLETLRDSESQQDNQIAMAEVALHNFMDVLLHDLEDETKSDHSSKVQILDIFQWSLKVNVDAQEKIRYLEAERARLEDERQRELEELRETERRLEQERARRKIEEEKRRRKIRELEQHLAQEQRALAAANKKAYHTMKRNNQYRQPPIPEEEEAAWPGGKPVVAKMKDDGSIDPATLPRRQQQQDPRGGGMGYGDHLHKSSGDISHESDNQMQYIVTEPSPSRVPELEQEGTLPRQADVKRMPSWTIIGEKRIVMASSDSVDSASHGSIITNHLPSSFHENDAIRNLSDSDSSKKGARRRKYSSGSVGRLSVGSSLDIPDLASINEESVLNSVDSPPYIAKGGDAKPKQYPGGVPRVASAKLKAQPSMRHKFERVSSSGRIGLVSASGDVFIDDVYRESARKIVSDADTSAEQMGASPDSERRHTALISVGSAGDIHVGSTVRFNESPDSSSEADDASSSSEEVTIDSDLDRDAQTDAKKPVPHVSRRYGKGGRKKRLGGRLKQSLKAVRNRGKCVTNSWFCESASQRYGDIAKQSKRLEEHSRQLEMLAGQECLLHAEDDPYDRTHVLEPTRLSIDDTGFVIDRR